MNDLMNFIYDDSNRAPFLIFFFANSANWSNNLLKNRNVFLFRTGCKSVSHTALLCIRNVRSNIEECVC